MRRDADRDRAERSVRLYVMRAHVAAMLTGRGNGAPVPEAAMVTRLGVPEVG